MRSATYAIKSSLAETVKNENIRISNYNDEDRGFIDQKIVRNAKFSQKYCFLAIFSTSIPFLSSYSQKLKFKV